MHHNYMQHALQLAEKGRLTVSPNPMVGCVIVKNNQIIGQGFHQRAGGPHAEIYALQAAGTKARDAIAYISLEPCCHYGRTGPCTEALIQSGIKKIIVACLDPNPCVAGKGIEILRASGIEVEVGLCGTEAQQLNEIFFHYIQYKQPFVIAKWAMSLDGKTITQPTDDKAITHSETNFFSHEFRQQVDAMLIGARTAVQDNPLLTVRLKHYSGKHPLRIILSKHGNLPLGLQIFSAELPAKTMVITTEDVDPIWYKKAIEKKVEIMICPKNQLGEVDLKSMLIELGKREITSLLVEGGMQTHERFFQANLINKTHVYLAPYIIGSLTKKQALKNVNFMQLGNDYFFSADMHKNEDKENV